MGRGRRGCIGVTHIRLAVFLRVGQTPLFVFSNICTAAIPHAFCICVHCGGMVHVCLLTEVVDHRVKLDIKK